MPDDVVRGVFDPFSADFDKHLSNLAYRGPELVAGALARRLPPSDGNLDILDGGCGTGLGGPHLKPYARTLTGVDLSPGMLAMARKSGYFDKLVEAELGAYLDDHPNCFDVCIFADVFIYFGNLNPIIAASARALKAGGLITFSVEKALAPGFNLHLTGRYSHHLDYLCRAIGQAGLIDTQHFEAAIRTEGHIPVSALILSARKPDRPNTNAAES